MDFNFVSDLFYVCQRAFSTEPLRPAKVQRASQSGPLSALFSKENMRKI